MEYAVVGYRQQGPKGSYASTRDATAATFEEALSIARQMRRDVAASNESLIIIHDPDGTPVVQWALATGIGWGFANFPFMVNWPRR